jgi:GNAT superfamily N-acetyltransferase
MGWRTARKTDLNDLLSFLLPREAPCVAFTSRLRSRGKPSLPGRLSGSVLIRREGRAPIEGAVLRTHYGLLMPVFGDGSAVPADRKRESLQDIALPGPAASVMGLAADVAALLEALPGTIREIRNYYLMLRRASPPTLPPAPDPELRARPALPEDAPALFPLQSAYEKEEVLLDGDRFNPAAARILLERSLRDEIIWMAEYRGTPIAKAGTNARGFEWDQLGGIFVNKDWRKRGVGTWLVASLVSELAAGGRNSCLFVKKANATAIGLYRRLGFEIIDNYTIAYYK